MIDKSELRISLLKKRRSLSSAEVGAFSKRIITQFKDRYEDARFNNVMLYSPFDNEPDICELARYFKNKNSTVSFPYIEQNEIIPKIPGDSMFKRSFGILEPAADSPELNPSSLDLVIVPGIGFDRHKNRIGFGKGYYDRLLNKTSALKLALAYSFQITDRIIDATIFDVPMDAIITESEIID